MCWIVKEKLGGEGIEKNVEIGVIWHILPFACPCVIDVLFYEEADASSAVDFVRPMNVNVIYICAHPMTKYGHPVRLRLCVFAKINCIEFD